MPLPVLISCYKLPFLLTYGSVQNTYIAKIGRQFHYDWGLVQLTFRNIFGNFSIFIFLYIEMILNIYLVNLESLDQVVEIHVSK